MECTDMKIAFVSSQTRGHIDQLLSEIAADLQSTGAKLCGAVKILVESPENSHACDMDLQILPDGPAVRITQSLGEGSQGCRLNPIAITEAVVATEKIGSDGFDLFILNKFGPEESEGRGFCAAIATALENDTPVLVGVGASCRMAFDKFAAGYAEELSPDPKAIRDWCDMALNHEAAI